MSPCHSPVCETERLRLRPFTAQDIDALWTIYGDEEVNTFLPWFPVRSRDEAAALYEQRYAAFYRQPQDSQPYRGYRYALCLKSDDVPRGYVHVSADDSHDLGYALGRDWWGRGLVTEACRAVIAQARQDGLPYLTATHDVNNARSGAVMRRLGMRYCYSYEEQWQPKDFPVVFRLYQLHFDGRDDVYRRYWDQSAVHWIETGLS